MKKIKLTQGKFAIVDDEDFDKLNKYKWCINSNNYALRRASGKDGDGKIIYMHRVIIGETNGLLVDHINRDKTDNRKSNLRLANKSQNCMNRSSSNHTSSYKGVGFHKQSGKWRSFIFLENKYVHLGLFENEKDAAITYNKSAEKLFKEFAYLNEVVK